MVGLTAVPPVPTTVPATVNVWLVPTTDAAPIPVAPITVPETVTSPLPAAVVPSDSWMPKTEPITTP